MGIEYGTIDTIDTGSVRRVLNTDYPIRHALCRAGHGWFVTKSLANGAGETAHYSSEQEARAAFELLRGEIKR
jgi:hypothetical protein